MTLQEALQTRRKFLAGTTAALALASWGVLAADARPRRLLKAAVIGHTGRGDYGHGLENIFADRQGVELVALADPDDSARKRAAGRIGAPRSYASYRELLEREQPHLVSVAMRHA